MASPCYCSQISAVNVHLEHTALPLNNKLSSQGKRLGGKFEGLTGKLSYSTVLILFYMGHFTITRDNKSFLINILFPNIFLRGDWHILQIWTLLWHPLLRWTTLRWTYCDMLCLRLVKYTFSQRALKMATQATHLYCVPFPHMNRDHHMALWSGVEEK